MAYLLTHCDLAVLAAGGNPHLDILVGTPSGDFRAPRAWYLRRAARGENLGDRRIMRRWTGETAKVRGAARVLAAALVAALGVTALGAAPGEATAAGPQIAQHLTGRLVTGPGTTVDETALWGVDVLLGAGVRIGPRARLGDRVRIGDGSTVEADATVGADARLGRGVTIEAGASVTPETTVPDGAVVTRGD